MRTIYLDHAATTPVDPVVAAAMMPYMTDRFYNPSAEYTAAREVRADIAAARSKIAQHIGARSSEIIFTAGGTEANNLAIKGVMDTYTQNTVVISSTEHDSVRHTADTYKAVVSPVQADGRIDISLFEASITDATALVSIQYVNNEIGTIQPISEIAAIIKQIKTDRRQRGVSLPLLLHTDACQAPAYLDMHVSRLGVDLMTFNASKLYGPKQIGALYVRGGVELSPQILGGGQERGQRSGTENVPAIIGFAAALELVADRRLSEVLRLKKLQKQFVVECSRRFPDSTINGSLKHRVANNLHVTFPGTDNERLMIQLDTKGIMCAVGSACSASSDEPSHVLQSIGLSKEAAQSSLRFTMGNSTTADDIAVLLDTLEELLG